MLFTRRCARAAQVGGSWKSRHATVCPRAAVSDEPASSALLTGCLLVCFLFVENAHLQVAARAAAGDAGSDGIKRR